MPTLVPSDGPLTARVLWVGEAPGREEVLQGRPFIGASGKIVRRTLRWAGVDVERDVRFSNAVRYNPGSFPTGLNGAQLLKSYADELDREIASMPNLKVIVACGGPAMTRLTGRRSKETHAWGIDRYHNFVFHNTDLPDVMTWAPGVMHYARVPESVCVIPVLHPAGIMRTKGRDELISFRRGVQKVKLALDGALKKVQFEEVFAPPVEVIDEHVQRWALEAQDDRSAPIYFDTEYNRESKQVHWVGFTFDGSTIFGVPWTVEYVPTITGVLRLAAPLAAHNIQADIQALGTSGLALWNGKKNPVVFDTLIAHHALHPALGVGLDDAARYYIDDIQQWKDMESNDPHYNALDVAYGWAVMQGQLKEAAARPVDPMPEVRARQALISVSYAMERRGMPVDRPCQQAMKVEAQERVATLREGIREATFKYWDRRIRAAATYLRDAERLLLEVKEGRWAPPCTKHPNRNGLYKPPKGCECCAATYSQVPNERQKYKRLQRNQGRYKRELERWEKGFEPRNNEHLRWLLYDPHAMRLPVQYTGFGEKRHKTANRAAIDKLSTLANVRARRKTWLIILDIKEVQHLEKAISTFIDIPLDSNGTAHPPYKIQGTRTGRLAGGKDQDEKSDNTYAFNVLNIPREWRRMYVAPPGHVLVAADWRNVEGRLTAFFSRDKNYERVLQAELTGGPKVHSVNASIIYGVDPSEAKSHEIELSGQKRTAYDGGKRLTHAWSYGMQPPHMSKNFNIPMTSDKRGNKGAVEIDTALCEAYPQLVRWRDQLVADVIGVWERVPGKRAKQCVESGRYFLSNPFGWQFHFLGVEGVQANEVIAFLPQSTGAGMFTRVAPILERRYPIFTGTYDSFALIVPADPLAVREAVEFLTQSMERAWPEIDNRTFPCEVQVGYNWGEASDSNPRGLKEVA